METSERTLSPRAADPAKTPWYDRFVVFSAHTATAPGHTPRFVQIAAALYEAGEENQYWSSLVDPEFTTGVQHWKCTSPLIDLGKLRRQPPLHAVLPRFTYHLHSGSVAGHGIAAFDQILAPETRRVGSHFPDPLLPGESIDIRHLDLGLNPGRLRRRLKDVARRWGVPYAVSYSALDQARTVAKVLLAMRGELPKDDLSLYRHLHQWGEQWEQFTRRFQHG